MRSLAIVKPSPTPDGFLDEVSSSLLKFWNSLSRLASEMPTPVSLTMILKLKSTVNLSVESNSFSSFSWPLVSGFSSLSGGESGSMSSLSGALPIDSS